MKKEDELISLMETSIKKVLKSTKASNKEVMQAVAEAGRLLVIKHKICGDDEPGGFFNNKG